MAGQFAFIIPGFDFESFDMAGIGDTNVPIDPGQIEIVGELFKLTLPISVPIESIVPGFGLDLNFGFTGELVAFAPVPEPASLALLAFGTLAFLEVVRRARRGGG